MRTPKRSFNKTFKSKREIIKTSTRRIERVVTKNDDVISNEIEEININEMVEDRDENNEERLTRKSRKFSSPDIQEIFNNYNCESSVYRGIRLNKVPVLFDQTFLFGIMKTFTGDFVDYTNAGASLVLLKKYETNFLTSNNIDVFTTETITTKCLENTLKTSTYESIDNLAHIFANMDIEVAEASKNCYNKNKIESEMYKKKFNEEMIRRRNNKPIIECCTPDLSERCFVLTYAFKLFENENNTNMKYLNSYSKREAKDLLSILDDLLSIYSEKVIIEAIGVSSNIYKKGVKFFREISEFSPSDGIEIQGDKGNIFNKKDNDIIEELIEKKTITFMNIEYKTIRKRRTTNGDLESVGDLRSPSMIRDIIKEVRSRSNDSRVRRSRNPRTAIILESDQILKDKKLKEMLLNSDAEELMKTKKIYPGGVTLTLKKGRNTVYKFRMDLNNKKIVSLLNKIERNSENGKNCGNEEIRDEEMVVKEKVVPLEDETPSINKKSLRKKRRINYFEDTKR